MDDSTPTAFEDINKRTNVFFTGIVGGARAGESIDDETRFGRRFSNRVFSCRTAIRPAWSRIGRRSRVRRQVRGLPTPEKKSPAALQQQYTYTTTVYTYARYVYA